VQGGLAAGEVDGLEHALLLDEAVEDAPNSSLLIE
jgi:hypothetical protein